MTAEALFSAASSRNGAVGTWNTSLGAGVVRRLSCNPHWETLLQTTTTTLFYLTLTDTKSECLLKLLMDIATCK